MKMNKFWATATAVALLGGGLALAAPLSASAHTPDIKVNCSALSVTLTNYADTVSEVPAVAPVYHDSDEVIVDTPAVAGHPAVSAVTHTEYEFKQKSTGKTKTNRDLGWNPGRGWSYDGNTVTIVDSPAVPEVPAIPAVTHTVHHHDLVTPGKDAVPAKTNTVKVTIDGTTVTDTTFGSSFIKSYTFDNKYVAHTYSVTATAWDSSEYNVNESGTTTPCSVPVVGPHHGASIQATCGAATVTLTNAQAQYEANQQASYVVYVDGKFYDAYAVPGNETKTVNLTFSEDSGEHTVVVRTGPAQGDTKLAEQTVKSDCILPQPDATVVKSEWVDGKFACGDKTVEQSRTVTTTPYVLVEGKWVADTEHVTSVKETQKRDLTATEIASLNCPVAVVTPPTAPVTSATKPVTQLPTPDVLPFTGASTGWLILPSLAVILLGVGGVISARRRASSN
jgi:hypothetical protein